MIVRFAALALLLAILPSFAMSEPLQTTAIVSVILATAALTIAIFLPPTILARLARLMRPLLIITLVAPALWMVLQVLPIPLRGLGNPIWATASAALNEPLATRFTVDLRATMLSLAQYNAILATALVTAVVTLERQRAAHILYFLTCITVLISVLTIWKTISPS